jgi:hypothetical protein
LGSGFTPGITDNWIQSLDAKVCTPGVLQEVSEGYALGETDSHLLLGNIYYHVLLKHYFHICGMPPIQPLLGGNSRSRQDTIPDIKNYAYLPGKENAPKP